VSHVAVAPPVVVAMVKMLEQWMAMIWALLKWWHVGELL
jgi:hypothetical protein